MIGGWGAGKSTAGSVKALERQRRGCDGIAVSPDFAHFKKSLWPTLREWIPWDQVVPKHQRYENIEWAPGGAFTIVFKNRTQMHCGGIKDATSWYGGNVNYALFDEASRYPDDSAFKSLMGRIRIVGPNGEPPQLFLTTTPEMNWLAERFGPWDAPGDDPFAAFKAKALVARVLTEENVANLDPEYAQSLADGLTDDEAELFLRAGWVHVVGATMFVNPAWWDACYEPLPAWGREPCCIGVDAAKGSEQNIADCFAVVACTRHPSRPSDVAVRYCGIWQAEPGRVLDYDVIEAEIRRLCRERSVLEIAYDPWQLHQMMMGLRREGVAHTREFSQMGDRNRADKGLQDLIVRRGMAHDGNPVLASHVKNANIRKTRDDTGQVKIRMVKRAPSLKIDAAVAAAMAADRILYYNV